jgi:prophage regulatory protein
MSSSPSNEPAADCYLRTKEVLANTGLSRTTIHRLVKDGDFPSPKRLGKRAVGWLSSDVARWREARPEARNEAKAA